MLAVAEAARGSGSSLKTHWESYAKAALANGHPADRNEYHVSQTVLVADTDAKAKKRALDGGIGYCWEHYLWPIWERFALLSGFIADKGAQPSDVNILWICDTADAAVVQPKEKEHISWPWKPD
jgi:hypothetical protein